MLMKIVKTVGQPVCVVLYAIGAVKAVKEKQFGFFAGLFFTHLTEYFIIGRKTGKEFEIKPIKALLSCLSFGFTWWLPVRMNKKDKK